MKGEQYAGFIPGFISSRPKHKGTPPCLHFLTLGVSRFGSW